MVREGDGKDWNFEGLFDLILIDFSNRESTWLNQPVATGFWKEEVW